VVENVEGLSYRIARPLLDRFLEMVRRAGYHHVQPIEALDAQDFGVPQRRRRIFILGYRRGLSAPRYPRPATRPDSHRPSVWDALGD
jgi:DNA (cytosine-5)-methyltransferase 1